MKKRIGLFIGVFIAAGLFSVAPVSAQQPPQGPGPQVPPSHHPGDPLADSLFPASLVMQHQRELGLTDEQKTFIRGEVQKTTNRFLELQWQLQDAMEALHETMMSDSATEQQALAQLDKVLDAEREVKRLHITMAIRIKNDLTPEQREKLYAMLKMSGPGQGHGSGHGSGQAPRPGPGPDEDPD